MAWIMDEYSRSTASRPPSHRQAPSTSSAPGCEKRPTGRGVVMALEEYVRDAKAGEIKDKTFAVQGFATLARGRRRSSGSGAARSSPCRDVGGAIRYRPGLDIPALTEHVKTTRSVIGFPGSETISNDELLTLDVDVLVPAALGGVITSKNVNDIRARIVLEAANAPTTPEADEALTSRGVVVLPDIYVNAGGVTVSYFEWAQNIQQFTGKRTRSTRSSTGTCARRTPRWRASPGSARSHFGRPPTSSPSGASGAPRS